MISSVLALLLAATAVQSDATRTAREAYTGCLRTYVDRGANDRMAPAAFVSAYPQQCTAQESAYRDAIVRRETANRATRADAQEAAQMEIDDARTNFYERFAMSLPEGTSMPDPQAAATATAAAAPAPAATATATPAAQPASATTTPQ